MDLPKIEMVATIPPIQSAIKISGEGSARISIDVPESELAQVTKLFLYSSQTFKLTIEEWNADAKPPEAAPEPRRDPGNSLAYRMHRNGYFFNPKLWEAMEEKNRYDQGAHKKFLERQPCLCSMLDPVKSLAEGFYLGGLFVPGHIRAIPCHGDRIVHHARSAANAGTSIKPPDWYGVTVCDEHHKAIHSKETTREFNQALEAFAASITAARMKVAMKFYLEIDSLSELDQPMLDAFHEEIGVRPAGF